mgnify:FL=1
MLFFCALFTIGLSVQAKSQTLLWQQTNAPGLGIIRSFVASGNTIIFGGDGRIIRSVDDGLTWSLTNAPIGNSVNITALVANSSTVFAATSRGILRSTDNGMNWSFSSNGLPINADISDIMVNGNTLYITISAGIYRSGDNGNTWQAINLGNNRRFPYSFAIIDTNYFGATGLGSILRFSESGTSWTEVTFQGLTIFSLGTRGRTLFAGTDGGVLRSDDLGVTWNNFNSGLPTQGFVRKFITNGNNIYADYAMLNELGTAWIRIFSSISGISIRGINTNGNTFFGVNGNQNIFRAKLTPTSVRLNNEYAFDHVTLNPNPTDDISTISMFLTTSVHLNLKLYDALGREIKIIADGIYSAGQQQFSIGLQDVHTGIYFVRGNIGEQVLVRRLVVVK